MNQILKAEQIVGKTISNVISGERDLYIKFSDGSFCVFENNNLTEGYGYIKHAIEISDYPLTKTSFELIKLGIITKDEYDIAVKDRETEWEIQKLQRIVDEKARQEDSELEQFN